MPFESVGAVSYSPSIVTILCRLRDITSRTDRRTDRQTDRIVISISRVSVLTRDKNVNVKLHNHYPLTSLEKRTALLCALLTYPNRLRCLWKRYLDYRGCRVVVATLAASSNNKGRFNGEVSSKFGRVSGGTGAGADGTIAGIGVGSVISGCVITTGVPPPNDV